MNERLQEQDWDIRCDYVFPLLASRTAELHRRSVLLDGAVCCVCNDLGCQ